jgi:DNA-binding response OmpR family regulator
MRLLLVEDQKLLGAAMHEGLQRFGYAVDWARTGKEALASLNDCDHDCVLLDLWLPDMPGETVLKLIRERNPQVPVIVTTARGGILDRVQLLDIGADDYMVKPVDLDELSARVRAVLRRPLARADSASEPEHGPLKLYPLRRTATWHGEPVPLTNKEFWLLETLVRRKNEVLSRDQLEHTLYGWGEEVDSNAVQVYIHHLRRKFAPDLINTVRGFGYQLGPTKLNG